jgi:Flp pilus assembly protein TadG
VRIRRRKKGERGQVLIEFLIVSTMIFTLIFVFVAIAWGIAYGHYVQYATYISARAYLSSNTTQQDQATAAADTLRSMVMRGQSEMISFLAKARRGDDRDAAMGAELVPGASIGTHPQSVVRMNSRKYSWAEGVQYNYSLRLFLLPLAGWMVKEGKGTNIQPGTGADPSKAIEYAGTIPFTSDSYLGREVSFSECWQEMERISTFPALKRLDGAVFIEDNGC